MEKKDEYDVTFVEVDPVPADLQGTLEEKLRQAVPKANAPVYYW